MRPPDAKGFRLRCRFAIGQASARQASSASTLSTVRRVVVEHLQPLDDGRFPIKRTSGETSSVTADVFADGHDSLAGVLKYRHGTAWTEVPLTPGDNDSWGASFTVTELGEYEYTVEAWIDRFGSWLKGLVAKADAGQDVGSELLEGAELIQQRGVESGSSRTTTRPARRAMLDGCSEIADLLRSDRAAAGARRRGARSGAARA